MKMVFFCGSGVWLQATGCKLQVRYGLCGSINEVPDVTHSCYAEGVKPIISPNEIRNKAKSNLLLIALKGLNMNRRRFLPTKTMP